MLLRLPLGDHALTASRLSVCLSVRPLRINVKLQEARLVSYFCKLFMSGISCTDSAARYKSACLLSLKLDLAQSTAND